MKRQYFFAIIVSVLFLCACPNAPAQTTQVSATVLDPGGKPYQNCTGSANFVPSPTATTVPTISGSTFQTIVPIAACDSFGKFSMTLVDNNQVSDGHTGGQASQWSFFIQSANVCFVGQKVSFSTTLTITGASQDISAALTAAAASLPSCGGGGGSGPALQTNGTPNTLQTVLNLKSGNNVSLSSDGSGGVTLTTNPGTPSGCLQYDLAGIFTGASGICTSDGSSLSIKGIGPWVDVTAYGARSNAAYGGTVNATCNGTTSITLSGALDFINGDGLAIYGCGPTNAMSTPGAPTVTNVYDAGGTRTHQTVADTTGGATEYCYKIVAENISGGLTASSSSTCTMTGLATMGVQSATATAASLSNDTITLTVTTPLKQGAVVDIGATTPFTNSQYNGWFQVCTNPGTTLTFCGTPLDSRAMPSNYKDQTSLTANANVSWYAGNKVTWSAVTGAVRYYICVSPDNVTFTLDGQSLWNNTTTGATDLAFEDWGSTYMANQTYPWYISNAICSGSATNGILATTITAGGGTTSITVANAATQSTSGAKTIHDNEPNFKNAMNAASSPTAQGVVYIPPTTGSNGFQINSVLQVPGKLSVKEAGELLLGAPLYLQGNVTWDGSWANLGAAQFGTSGSASWNGGGVVSAANPVAIVQGNGNVLRNVTVSVNQNASVSMLADNLDGELYGVSLPGYASSNDTLGIDFVSRDASGTIDDIFMDHVLFTGGPNQAADASWTPMFMVVPVSGSEGQYITMNYVNWSRRGYVAIGSPPCAALNVNWSYRQGGITPMFGMKNCGGNLKGTIQHVTQDTEGQPLIFNMSGALPPAATQGTFDLSDFSGGTQNGIISGTRALSLKVQQYGNGVNNNGGTSNRNSQDCHDFSYPVVASPFETGAGDPKNEAICRFNMPVQIVGGYSLGANLNPPTSITATGPGSGGSVPNGTYVYSVSSVGFDSGESMAQPVPSSSVTTTTGNNTVTVGWTPTLGAISQNIYRCNTGLSTCTTGGTMSPVSGFYRIATHVTGSSFSDTVASTTGDAPTYVTATTSNGLNNANGVWGTAFNQVSASGTSFPLGQLICSGQIALSTGAIGSGARGTNTLTCTGLSATTDTISCTFSGDTNAVTGYAPSASGGLSLKTWASTNTINVDQVNDTGSSITPGAATVNCKGIR